MFPVLDGSAACAALLPGGTKRLHMVLFFRSSASQDQYARERFNEVQWPVCLQAIAVDLDKAPEVANWFSPPKTPMLAVVADGSMLDMAYECSLEAAQRLADSGQAYYLMLNTLNAPSRKSQ